MPETQSQEKIDLLRILGAEVRLVPVVPVDDPKHYNKQAREFAQATENAVYANQFDNLANRQGHFESTGPEIWQQTLGKVTAFTCASGTGGTISGISAYLKQQNPRISIYLAEPRGSVQYSYIKSQGKLLERAGTSITEGIGQGRITENFAMAVPYIDDAILIPDERAIEMVSGV